MPEVKSSPGCIRNAVIPESSPEPDNGNKAEVTRTTPENSGNHDNSTVYQKSEPLPLISSFVENVDNTNPMSVWTRPQIGAQQDLFSCDLDEVAANTAFADVQLSSFGYGSLPSSSLPYSSLLHKYSNVSGVPQMDSRTVLTSAHEGSTTINSPTTTVTHSCNSPKLFSGTDEHSFSHFYTGSGKQNPDVGISQSYNTNFSESSTNPLMGDSGCHLTPADTIFHMHACDDFLAESFNNLSLFSSFGSESAEQQNLPSTGVLRKLAGGFVRDDGFPDAPNQPESAGGVDKDQSGQRKVSQNVTGVSPGSMFGMEHQALPAEYCPNQDLNVIDSVFPESFGDGNLDSGMPGANYLFLDLPKQEKSGQSTKVVAEVLADFLDDVDDVPFFMNEIESGLTSTPDAKDVKFSCAPSLSLESSWSPSIDKTASGHTSEKSADQKSKDSQKTNLFGKEASSDNTEAEKDICGSFHGNFRYNMPPLSSAFSEPPSGNNNTFSTSLPHHLGSDMGFSGVPAPPPPPPPAPTTITLKYPLNILQGGSSDKSGQDDVSLRLKRFVEESSKGERKFTLVSFHFQELETVLQEGPSCGIVALAMTKDALQRPDVSVDDILTTSKTRGYSALGEMFSAFDMLKLAMEVYGCGGDILDMEEGIGPREQLILHLINAHPCLVPYDSDRNHEPCLKKGHKAHWALLTGAVFVLDEEQASYLSEDFTRDPAMPQLFHSRPDTDITTLHGVSRLAEDVLVYGRQGKSRHTGLWSLTSLLESNGQLTEVDPNREEDSNSYVLPKEGIAQTLCNKVVVLWS